MLSQKLRNVYHLYGIPGADIDSQGEVSFSNNAFTENVYKNFKGVQRNMRFLGTMYMTSEDGGTPSAEFMIQGVRMCTCGYPSLWIS